MTSRILNRDVLAGLRSLEPESVQTCITSPPYYGLRDYGVADQIGLEETPEAYVAKLVEVFREMRRVLKDDGTVWLNLGDSYAGHNLPGWRDGNEAKNGGASNKNGCGYIAGLKPKDLIGIPWRVAFALQADRWYLRSDIIWAKPNPMPESVRDRPTKAHEYLFLLAKSERYFYDADAVKERAVCVGDSRHLRTDKTADFARPDNGSRARTGKPQAETRNRRSVWTITPRPFRQAHFAVMPEALVEPCVLAGSKPGDVVLDPFAGSGTVGVVALRHGRRFVGCELNSEYAAMARNRISESRRVLAAAA